MSEFDLAGSMERLKERVAKEVAVVPPPVVADDSVIARLVAQGVPLRAARHAIAAHDTPSLDAVRDWLADDGKCLLALAGPKGVGKTVAAAWAMAQPRRRNPAAKAPARCIAAGELARLDRYSAEAVGSLLGAAMLVIDDLGVEFADVKGAFSSLLDEVINSRYGNELRTLITTNLTAVDFKARFGERIADRIREAGTWFERGGASLRLPVKAVP